MSQETTFKNQVIEAFIVLFEQERSALIESAKAAHSAATHEESRAEDRHDTFAIEASYLAAGQATRVNELEKCIAEFRSFLENSKVSTRVQTGTLVLFKSTKPQEAIIAMHGGGSQVQVAGRTVGVISPHSPMGEEMMGLSAEDEFTLETKIGTKSFQILQTT